MKKLKVFIAAVVVALAAFLCAACTGNAESDDGGDDNTPIETPIIRAS